MVKIRMRRTGCTNHATYRIVAADERSPRDGKFLEILGWYDTQIKDENFKLDLPRVDYWLSDVLGYLFFFSSGERSDSA